MAYGNWRDYLRGRGEVSLKKYLYVFRPLLACRWIERQLGQVPMLFAQLVESVLDEADVRAALAELVARKQAGEELAVAPPVEALTRFIEAELPRLEALNEPDEAAGEVEELNGFFRRYALAAGEEETTTPSVSAIRQHRRGDFLSKVGASEKLRPVVAGAVNHSRDLHTVLDWPVEDEVIADRQKTKFRSEVGACLSRLRLFRKNFETPLDRIKPTVGSAYIERTDMAPDFVEVTLRRTRDAVETHAAEVFRAPSTSRPRAFTPSKNERNSASSLHSTPSPRSS